MRKIKTRKPRTAKKMMKKGQIPSWVVYVLLVLLFILVAILAYITPIGSYVNNILYDLGNLFGAS